MVLGSWLKEIQIFKGIKKYWLVTSSTQNINSETDHKQQSIRHLMVLCCNRHGLISYSSYIRTPTTMLTAITLTMFMDIYHKLYVETRTRWL